MKKRLHIIILLLLSQMASFAGGRHSESKDKDISFVYDVDFEMNFDNRELYRSAFSESMTIFGARLAPAVGLSFSESESTSHFIMAGIDVMKDFGASPVSAVLAGGQTAETDSKLNNLSLFREITLYYNLEKKAGDTDISIYAGIFPRRKMEARYSRAFFSDSLRFYDNNLEGILLQFRRPKAFFEVGCDWMGKYGDARRERFMVYSGGEGKVASVISIGYSGYMYHFANSRQVKGLVDNILINPYAVLDLSGQTGMQAFSLTLGYLQAFQHNRMQVGHYVFPGGVHLDAELRKWDVAIRNMAYYGNDLMPYYNFHDMNGTKYGNDLYLGDPFYRVHDDNSGRADIYDRLEFCYEPQIGRYMKMKVAAIFHFNGFHYSGCQQMVGINICF